MPCVNGSRIVVITQGPRETILAGKRLGIVKYKVLPIDQKLVIDTTGAGDAFCGGFISSLLDSSKLKTRNGSRIHVYAVYTVRNVLLGSRIVRRRPFAHIQGMPPSISHKGPSILLSKMSRFVDGRTSILSIVQA